MVDDKKSEELKAGEKMPSSLSTEGSTTTEEHIKDGGEEFEKDWKKVTLIMMSLYLTMFLVALDRLIIGTAIPAITDDFHAINDVGWYAGAYLLTSSAFQLIFGRIYTFYPPKWVMLIAILIFEIGSAICGAAPNSTAFIIGRAIAGLGSAGILGGCVVIMLSVIPLHKRPVYQAFFGAVFGVASISGPLLGGVFTDKLTWRWCFYINIPIGAVIVVILSFLVKAKSPKNTNSVQERVKKLDPLGSLFFLPGIVCLLLALQWGGTTYSWSNARIIVLFILAIILVGLFITVQLRIGENATVPIRIIKQRSVAAAACLSFIMAGSMITMVYFLPIWFQAIKGDSAVHSGIHTLPMILALVVISIMAGGAIKRTGYYVPNALLASVFLAVGCGLISTFTPSTGSPKWIGYQVVYGAGLGLGMQVPNLAVQTVLNKTDAYTGIAVIFFTQGLGGSIFVAISQVLFTAHLTSGLSHIDGLDTATILKTGATELKNLVPEAMLGQVLDVYNGALRKTFYVALACACATLLAGACLEWRSMKGLQEGGAVVKQDKGSADIEKGSRRSSQNQSSEKE